MNPLVSVITLNWNRKEDVKRTLSLILKQTYKPKEILMVDNGSTDGSVESIHQSFPEVRIITLSENRGVQGYNEGISSAAGDIFLLIDNDMDLLQEDSLENIVNKFESNPQLGVVALQVRECKSNQLSPNNPKYWQEKGNDNTGYPCSTFDGGGVAFRREALAKVGLYLPQFFVYHSEVDLSTRIWDAGYEIRYFPEIAVCHRESPVARNLARQTLYTARNYLWYVWIYYPRNMIVSETFDFLQRSFIQNLRTHKPIGSWIRGVFAAIFGWSSIKHVRKPVRQETIEWMQLLRDKDRERKENVKRENVMSNS
jgi:GT2 family glycosyltransferase